MSGELIIAQDITMLSESGLITQEAKQQLVTAAAAIPAMRDASTPVGKRHFARIDTFLSIRNPSPVDRARDVLTTLDTLWSGASSEFHRLREMAFDIKLRQARLNIKLKRLPEGEDERIVTQAECELEQAQIDRLKATFAEGQGKIQGVIAKATAQAQRYALLCREGGVVAFTADDFILDEVKYLIKTAFWHAGQNFRTVDGRDKWTKKRDEAGLQDNRQDDFKRMMKARGNMSVRVSMDVGMYFECLGITKDEVRKELAGIEEQRHQLSRAYEGHPNPPSFYDYFEAWLTKMENTYKDRVLASIQKHGPDRLKRMQQIITPTTDDQGKTPGTTLERGSLTE